MTRILIADDHEVVRSGLQASSSKPAPGWQVVAEVGDGKEAIDKAIEARPDVAIVDYSLPRHQRDRERRARSAPLPRRPRS